MNTLAQLLDGTNAAPMREKLIRRDLPRSVVTHASVDDLALGISLLDSPRFRQMTTEDPPRLPPRVAEPEPIDITTASDEEVEEYRQASLAARQARKETEPYGAWEELTADVYHSYHTHRPPEIIDEVDPGVELHRRIMPKIISQNEHAATRNMTRDDRVLSEIATMGTIKALREVLANELAEQAQAQEEIEEHRQEAEDKQEVIDTILPPEGAPEPGAPVDEGPGGAATPGAGDGSGGTSAILSPKAQEELEQLTAERDRALQEAEDKANNMPPMGRDAMEALHDAARAGEEAADAAKNVPLFGAGHGAGEPVYTSPEQALSIAERWANNPELKRMAELFGRLDRDIRFKRSKRIQGGNDEIVDVQFGDNLKRTLPSELALLSDPDTEDEFYARYASQELLEHATVGEEHAGRGPILLVLDGSGSMRQGGGERNVWARAVAMCLLHMARLEKRDFGCIEFAYASQIEEWIMPGNKPLDGEAVIDMAAHFFGGGTTPLVGVQRAADIMQKSAPFKSADIVLVGDGDASFGPEDERLRDSLKDMGVRLFGIAIGPGIKKRSYLHNYCDHVVDVQDFDLTDPSAATAELAVHVT